MRRGRFSSLFVLVVCAVAAVASSASAGIRFSTPYVVDPLRANGEPDIGVDVFGRVFSSGPTGTGTQRSVWYGSVDRGRTYRVISPGPPPSAIAGLEAPPGGGDTDIAFDRNGKQYFSDLYALTCLRSATTPNAGKRVYQEVYPGGCSGIPGADRQWLAVYDPPAGTPDESAYTGPTPLIYQEYNDISLGAQWVKSNKTVDPVPGGPGLTYVNAEQDGPGAATGYAPFGADGYPAIDQVTGKVFQTAGHQRSDGKYNLLLNIGTPDAAGDLRFLDHPTADKPTGDLSQLIHVADGLPGSPDTLFTVTSMDSARNLYVVWAIDSDTPALRQVYVSGASAATGWRTWTRPTMVSFGPTSTRDAVNIFPWIKAGGAGRADAVWYGSDKLADPSTRAGQRWNVFMAQTTFPTDASGHLTGAAPTVSRVRVTPHPMHYNEVCLEGSACIASQGNRNLADFFEVTIDRNGAALVVYDDTSNGLVQPGFTPDDQQLADHSGAPVVTVARQSRGMGLYGTTVSWTSSASRAEIPDQSNDALYPVIGGTNTPAFDIVDSRFTWHVRGDASVPDQLYVTLKVANLKPAALAAAAAKVPGTQYLQYVVRWQFKNRIYYAEMSTTPAGARTFSAGRAQSVDLCSVSACFPHVITYPEPGFPGGHPESGSVSCPASPSASNPCTIRIVVVDYDINDPHAIGDTLEEIGSYALASSHLQGTTTNAQAFADNVPLEVDGNCCFNFTPNP